MAVFHIGHTGITWGYGAEPTEEAIRDVAELGYCAYETFGSVIEQYEQASAGSFGALLQRYGIPLSAAYCGTRFYDPADAGPDVDNVTRWAQLASKLGASTIVLATGKRQPQPYTAYQGMAEVFNEIGRRARDLGLMTAIHPHTGTIIETRAEIDGILTAVDPALVGFAPDTGQIAKGGSDAVAALDAYKAQIRHVHLKDYGGGAETGYAGYTPIGSGVVDMPAIFAVLEEAAFKGWVMVELDDTPQRPRPPREAAAMSKRYLEQSLGSRAVWRA
jgi:inosose dehydratase